MVILETRDLKKQYGTGETAVHALAGVNLSVENGEFVAVVGTSGSGKSTLLHMLGGLDRATSGKVYVDGKDIFALKDEELTIFRRRKIGFVFQSFNLVPVLSVYENIVLPLQLDGKTVDNAFIGEIAEALGLKEKLNVLPNQLSGGQQQRVAIARALAMEPELLVADEPIASLDVSIQAQTVNLFRHLQQEHGFTFLFIAHDLAMVEFLCDRVGVMYHGKLVEVAPVEALFASPLHPYTRALLAAMPVPDPRVERARKAPQFPEEGFPLAGSLVEAAPGHFVLQEGEACL